MSKTFVLVHGTWHGGWAWRDVVDHLSEIGYVAYTPTLAGHGRNAMRRGITHQHCVDSVVACIRNCNLEDVVLVGHSFGGTIIQKVADQIPDWVGHLVFLDALILERNECVFDVLPGTFLESLIAENNKEPVHPNAENADEILAPPPWKTWRNNFIQDAAESLAWSTWEQLSPEPGQVNLDKIDLERFYSLAIPKSFIFCRQDKAMPPGYFHPNMSSRLGARKVLEMDGSHEVMFTRPVELAEKIVEAIRE